MTPTRRAWHRRVYAHRCRRYHVGPFSWLARLRDAAMGGETCFHIALPKEDR